MPRLAASAARATIQAFVADVAATASGCRKASDPTGTCTGSRVQVSPSQRRIASSTSRPWGAMKTPVRLPSSNAAMATAPAPRSPASVSAGSPPDAGSSTAGPGASSTLKRPPGSLTSTTACRSTGRRVSRPTSTPPPAGVIRGDSGLGTGPRYGEPDSSTGVSTTRQRPPDRLRRNASCGSGEEGSGTGANSTGRPATALPTVIGSWR